MSLLARILSAPVTGPIQGVVRLVQTIHEQAMAEIYDEDNIRSALAELELGLDLGEITLEAYEKQEVILLERLNEMREAKRNG